MFDPFLAVAAFALGLVVGPWRRATRLALLVGPLFLLYAYVANDADFYGDGSVDALFWIFSAIATVVATVFGAALTRATVRASRRRRQSR